MAKKGMTRAVVNYTRRLKDMAGEALLQAVLAHQPDFRYAVQAAGGRVVPVPARKREFRNPFTR